MAYVTDQENEDQANQESEGAVTQSTASSGLADAGNAGASGSSSGAVTSPNVNLEAYLNANPGTTEQIYNMVTGDASQAADTEKANIDTQETTATTTANDVSNLANQGASQLLTNAVNQYEQDGSTTGFNDLSTLLSYNPSDFASAPALTTGSDFNSLANNLSSSEGAQGYASDQGYKFTDPTLGAMESAFYGSGLESGRKAANETYIDPISSYLSGAQTNVSNAYSSLPTTIQTGQQGVSSIQDIYNNAMNVWNTGMSGAHTPTTTTTTGAPTTTTTQGAGSWQINPDYEPNVGWLNPANAVDVAVSPFMWLFGGPEGGHENDPNAVVDSGWGSWVPSSPDTVQTATGLSSSTAYNGVNNNTYNANPDFRNTINAIASYLGQPGVGDYTGSIGYNRPNQSIQRPNRNVGRR